MATRRFVTALDLRENNKFFRADNIPCCLSAVGILNDNWANKEIFVADMLGAITNRVEFVHPNGTHVLYLKSGWLADNRINRYKRLWKAIAGQGHAIPNGSRSIEVVRERGNEIQFSGFIKIKELDASALAHLLIRTNNAFLLFSEDGHLNEILRDFSQSDVFDPRVGPLSNNGWLIDILCKGIASIYLPYGWVDERYTGLTYIFNEHSFPYR